MRDDPSLLRLITVLEQVDTLPGAQRESTLRDRNRQRNGVQRSLDVGRHVIRTFGSVPEPLHGWVVTRWHQPAEELIEVASHVRVRVLLDAERAGRVPYEQRQQPLPDSTRADEIGHVPREFVEAGAVRPYCEDPLHAPRLSRFDRGEKSAFWSIYDAATDQARYTALSLTDLQNLSYL